MSTTLYCTCCEREANMRCSGCYKVSLVVPFCSIEHQKMMDTHSSSVAFTAGGLCLCESPGTSSTASMTYLLSIALPFSRTGTMSERFTTTVVSKGGPEPDSTNVKNVRARFMAKAPDGETPSPTHFILPPPIHPSILPHILMSIPMGQLWCSEEVLRDGNVNRFAEAMLVFFTVVAHYIRDPTDSPDNHFIQLEVLSNRVELEAGRVRRRGPAVIPPELRGGFPPVSTVDSAIIMFEHARDFLRLKGWQYETFR